MVCHCCDITLKGNSPSKVATLVGCVATWRAYVSRFIAGSVMYIPPVVTDRQVHPLSRHRENIRRDFSKGTSHCARLTTEPAKEKTQGNIVIDTFDLTAHTIGNFDAWILDECDFLSSMRWSRLVSVARENRHVFQLLAGDPGQLRPRIDDGGDVAAGSYYCDLITLKEQLRFVADPPSEMVWETLMDVFAGFG